jgi:hypothetical protein
MATFVNPSTGHRREITSAAWLGALFFGIFYFMYRGVWRHVLIQVVLILIFAVALGPAALIPTTIMWIVYVFLANDIVEDDARRDGYRPEADLKPQPKWMSEPLPESPGVSDATWAAAMAECESSERNPGLWARVFAQAGGDEGKAKAAYIAERVRTMAAPVSVGGLGSSSPAPQRPPA